MVGLDVEAGVGPAVGTGVEAEVDVSLHCWISTVWFVLGLMTLQLPLWLQFPFGQHDSAVRQQSSLLQQPSPLQQRGLGT
jgi:hypothetical protein